MARTDPLVRFLRHVDKSDDGCWLWTGATNPRGYGVFWSGQVYMAAHRAAWELHVGPIPHGLEIDHLCRVRNCMRPDHLEPVTRQENNRRAARYRKGAHDKLIVGPTCSRGHLFVPANTYHHPLGYLVCRPCVRDKRRAQRAAA